MGLFIVIEGLDGAGGTTHSRILAASLEQQGHDVHLTQEPSDSVIGLLLRKFLKDNDVPPATDALLFAADRDIHYNEEIKKKLDDGFIVISDRYIESSIAYQSVQSDEISIEWVKEINKHIKYPDLTIILDISPQISLSRKTGEDLEKFENMPFLDKVREVYLKRAEKEGYHVVNSDDIIELVQEKIQEIVRLKLESS